MTGRALIDLSSEDFDDEVIDIDDTAMSSTTRPTGLNRWSSLDSPEEVVLRERTPRRRTRRNSLVNLTNSDDQNNIIIDVSGDLSPLRVARSHIAANTVLFSGPSSGRLPNLYQVIMDRREAVRNPEPRTRPRRVGLFTTLSDASISSGNPRTPDISNVQSFLSVIPEKRVRNSAEAAELGSCPICLNDYKPRMSLRIMTSACGHRIHKTCFDKWLCSRGVFKCPLDNLPLPFPKGLEI